MKTIKLKKHERIVAVVPEHYSGPGWPAGNRVVRVYIRDLMGGFRVECLQVEDQTPEMRGLFNPAAVMHHSLVGAVPVVVAKEET